MLRDVVQGVVGPGLRVRQRSGVGLADPVARDVVGVAGRVAVRVGDGREVQVAVIGVGRLVPDRVDPGHQDVIGIDVLPCATAGVGHGRCGGGRIPRERAGVAECVGLGGHSPVGPVDVADARVPVRVDDAGEAASGVIAVGGDPARRVGHGGQQARGVAVVHRAAVRQRGRRDESGARGIPEVDDSAGAVGDAGQVAGGIVGHVEPLAVPVENGLQVPGGVEEQVGLVVPDDLEPGRNLAQCRVHARGADEQARALHLEGQLRPLVGREREIALVALRQLHLVAERPARPERAAGLVDGGVGTGQGERHPDPG